MPAKQSKSKKTVNLSEFAVFFFSNEIKKSNEKRKSNEVLIIKMSLGW